MTRLRRVEETGLFSHFFYKRNPQARLICRTRRTSFLSGLMTPSFSQLTYIPHKQTWEQPHQWRCGQTSGTRSRLVQVPGTEYPDVLGPTRCLHSGEEESEHSAGARRRGLMHATRARTRSWLENPALHPGGLSHVKNKWSSCVSAMNETVTEFPQPCPPLWHLICIYSYIYFLLCPARQQIIPIYMVRPHHFRSPAFVCAWRVRTTPVSYSRAQ